MCLLPCRRISHSSDHSGNVLIQIRVTVRCGVHHNQATDVQALSPMMVLTSSSVALITYSIGC